LIFIYHQQNVFLFNQLNILKQVFIKPTPLLQKTSDNVLSLIEFYNSPYLDLESQSSKILPIIVLSKASNVEVRDAIR